MKTLREIQARQHEKSLEAATQDTLRASGGRVDPSQIDWEDPEFSIKRLYESMRSKLSEATAESTMPQLLRAGVSQFMFDQYKTVPTVYQDIVRNNPSNKYEELYAPLYNSEVPKEVLPSEPFEDSKIVGLDEHVPNRKFGRVIGFERELVEDDQTGQIQSRASNLGKMMAYVEEQTVINEVVTPSGATGYSTAIGNLNSGGGSLAASGQALLEAADIALQNMKDPLGNFLLVQPDTLLVAPVNKFDALKLINSTLQPSVPGASGQTESSASAGRTGYVMTTNPLQGAYDVKVTRFLPGSTKGLDGAAGSGAAFLFESKSSLVFQDRAALELVQEAPNAGTSFQVDAWRYRIRRRFAVRNIDTHFWYRIN